MGNFQSDDVKATAAANAEALGQVKLLRDLQELDYARLTEIVSDD
jgi:hypothetical protein